MDIPVEVDDYIRESIQESVGLPVSEKMLRLKLLTSEDERHRLQDQVFFLDEQLKEANKRLQLCREEASMNAQGIRKCIQEKEIMMAHIAEMEKYSSKMERECMLFERDLEKAMESCDDLERENKELRVQLQDNSSAQKLAAEIKSLQEDKENLRINLQRAEEEVKVLFEENRLLDEEIKRLLRQLHRERKHIGSDSKNSASAASARGKRKSRLKEDSPIGRYIDSTPEDQLRKPLSPLYQNSPQSLMK
ncbi:hypothetical protein AXF42_Ash019580 [Apostasia shenzhenica]|uniref:Uncharacterized protein n=1 Tax=Apostasia shenzhenica TaxID=1088818 RepID=A0A2I0AV91_9ASPA|nr:hypothetical protein AXF42_Ash019580 [Apostasia shenzhenica]